MSPRGRGSKIAPLLRATTCTPPTRCWSSGSKRFSGESAASKDRAHLPWSVFLRPWAHLDLAKRPIRVGEAEADPGQVGPSPAKGGSSSNYHPFWRHMLTSVGQSWLRETSEEQAPPR